MSCNSAIYTVNQTNATVNTVAGTFAQVPFGSVIRRFGRSLGLDGGSILCFCDGYFDVEGSVALTPTAAGPLTIKMQQDGVDIPGTFATVQGTADTPLPPIPIKGLVRNCGRSCSSSLTLLVDAPCTVTNAAFTVEKI